VQGTLLSRLLQNWNKPAVSRNAEGTIDEDLDPKKAADLWAKRKVPWPNFHATTEIIEQFPNHGVPYFVLIDGSGDVVFSDAGLNEDRLRTAMAKVNPAFATLSRTIAS